MAFNNFHEQLIEAEKTVLLSDKLDSYNAIVSMLGAGGTESVLGRDVAAYAYPLAGTKNYIKLLDKQDGDSAGIESAAFIIGAVYI